MKPDASFWAALLTILSLFMFETTLIFASETRTAKDMRGREVEFPADIKKVATIDDGFVEGVMTSLGVINTLAATSSRTFTWPSFSFDYETASGERFSHRGFNTIKTIHPWLGDLPSFWGMDGGAVNFEALAKVEPDLVIMRVGDCTMGTDDEKVMKTIATIEALGFPLLVLHSPSYCGKAELESMFEEIRLLGEVFGRRNRADELIAQLAGIEKMVRERTSGVKEGHKASVLYLGLNPDLRKKGAVGSVYGVNTPESYIIEKVSNAINAFQNNGFGRPLSTEQIYALDPDVIVLPASNGYHPPREIYEAAYFTDLGELSAIKNRRVYPMPFTPYNCSRRLEYPLDILVIAKAAYPEKFRDFSIYDFALKFYQDIYSLDRETAIKVRSAQLLDWMAGENF